MGMVGEAGRAGWTQMSFAAANDNLVEAARNGIDARLYWPGLGEVPVTELTVRRLLPLARAGLSRWGADSGQADRLLAITQQRALPGRDGAPWQDAALPAPGGSPSRTCPARRRPEAH